MEAWWIRTERAGRPGPAARWAEPVCRDGMQIQKRQMGTKLSGGWSQDSAQ
jgi:hypothetical protein